MRIGVVPGIGAEGHLPSRAPRPARDGLRRYVIASLHSTAMDLHVIGPLASPAERAAVDAVLGPPDSGWAGGIRNPATEGHASRGGHVARVQTLAAPPGPARGPVAGRLDQPAGPQLRVQAAGRRPGRGLRRGHVLCALRHEPAAAGRGPCLRRHRVPVGRRGGMCSGSNARSGLGRARRRRDGTTGPGSAARAWACAIGRRRPC